VADAASGFEIAVENGPEHAIERVPTGVTAFVGRALRGPVNVPVVVRSFAEYAQRFGGLWQPSTLSYAIEQYFENGGRTAIVVRVANGGRPPTLTLPARDGVLRLVALSPGSREYLRASVDYDGIGVNEPDCFNLVIQRIRTPGSELVEEQEIYRRLTVDPGSDRCVTQVLLESRLARVAGPLPGARPDRTPATASVAVIGYVASNPDGDDGAPLSDYDLIGSSQDGTGVFALKRAPHFDLLCVPPLSRNQDLGHATLLVAARLCRERQALLLVDPPADWTSADAALKSLQGWPFRSDQAAMFFPRVLAFDRLRGRFETFGSAPSAAGLISRADDTWPVWAAAEADVTLLRPGFRPLCAVSEVQRTRLAQQGVNTLGMVRAPARTGVSARTLAGGGSGAADWSYLSARRLALFIVASVERGTRWLVFEPDRREAWDRARAQVAALLGSLDEGGAFVGRTASESFFVVCDARLNSPASVAEGRVNLLFGFAPTLPGTFHAFIVTHTRAGESRTRPVSVNRLATSGARVAEEIEASLLRGLAFEG
jgi:hypothetical protein